MTASTRQTLHLHNRAHRAFESQPITYGVPWPQGAVQDAGDLLLRDESGNELPAGFKILNRWPDGSVQWTLADFSADFEPSGSRALTIEKGVGSRPEPLRPATARIEGNVATIGNGLVELTFSTQRGELLRSWTAEGKPVVEANGFDCTFRTQGATYSVRDGERRISVEHSNPLRAVLRLDGKHGTENGDDLLDYFIRFEIHAGRPDVKVTYSFRNRELPVPGIEIESMVATVKTTVAPESKRCFMANNLTRHYLPDFRRIDENPEIVTSDTGDLENYVEAHKNGARSDCFIRDADMLHDPAELKPWFLQNPQFRIQAGGNKCVWPYLGLAGEQGSLVAAFSHMTTLHPKSLSVDGSTLRFGIWPEWAGPLKITQGSGRSHSFHIAPLAGNADDVAMQNQYLSWEFGGLHTHVPSASPIEIAPDIEHVRACKVFAIDKLPAYEPDAHFSFERKVLDSWIGVSYGQLGAVDEVEPHTANGFWNYGDTVSGDVGTNNEEMAALVYFQNHLRTGNWSCAERAIASATHMMEVDYVAFSIDKYQHGGAVSHCPFHNHGAAYPSHMWFTELLFAYALTGDEEYKSAALGICENLLFWIADDDGFAIVAADQREAGQPMINLTWCYGFNPDERYLAACRKIIENCLMANVAAYGRMLDAKPHNLPVKVMSYGDYASWEGMFWYWEITGDVQVKNFMLEQLEWRLQPRYSGVHGFHRCTDYNPAAYAYYMTGDRSWLDRVARPFRAAFKAARWPLGWVHAMYAIKLAFELGIINDDDVLVQ